MKQGLLLRLCARDLAAIDALYLHRAERETSLSRLIGRDAIRADELALAAALGAVQSTESLEVGACASARLTRADGRVARRHLWTFREDARIARDVSIVDRAALSSDADFTAMARALGEAHPCHPPLGELRSGRGQLALQSPQAAQAPPAVRNWLDMWGLRDGAALGDIYAPKAACRGADGADTDAAGMLSGLIALLAPMPEAVLMLDQVAVEANHVALLWRLHGHPISGPQPRARRVRILGSSIFKLSNDRIVAEDTLYDRLALEAQRYQPIIGL